MKYSFLEKIFTNMKIRQTLSAVPFKFVVLFLILKCKKKCLFYQLKQFLPITHFTQVPITKVILTSLEPKIHFKLCHVPDSKINVILWKIQNGKQQTLLIKDTITMALSCRATTNSML